MNYIYHSNLLIIIILLIKYLVYTFIAYLINHPFYIIKNNTYSKTIFLLIIDGVSYFVLFIEIFYLFSEI